MIFTFANSVGDDCAEAKIVKLRIKAKAAKGVRRFSLIIFLLGEDRVKEKIVKLNLRLISVVVAFRTESKGWTTGDVPNVTFTKRLNIFARLPNFFTTNTWYKIKPRELLS